MRILLAFLIAALLCAAPRAGFARNASLELAVKATYLYKFAPFVEWPQAAFDSPASPMNICIVGTDPFGVILDQAVAAQRFVDRPIAIHRLSVASTRCHIAYIGGTEVFVAQALGPLRGSPVLTVTDVAPGAAVRGTINFVIVGNHVRFEIDEAAATRSGLTISSKLLRLARSTRPRS